MFRVYRSRAMSLALRSAAPRQFHSSRLVLKDDKENGGDDNDKDGPKGPKSKPDCTNDRTAERSGDRAGDRTGEPRRPRTKKDEFPTQTAFDAAAAAASGSHPAGGNAVFNTQDVGNPIHTTDRVLPIQLQHRPVFPGMASHFTTNDQELIEAINKLQESKRWNTRVVAVLGRKKSKTTQLVTNIDDVHTVGAVCRLQTVVFTHSPDNQLVMYATLFPLYRVRVGELVETVERIGDRTEGSDKPGDKNENALGETFDPVDIGVQWMTNIHALPNESYNIEDKEIERNSRRIVDNLNRMSELNPQLKIDIDKFSQLFPSNPGSKISQPHFLADFAASLVEKNEVLQDVLEILNIKERTRQVADLVAHEVEYMKVSQGIQQYGNDQTQQKNREIILREYYHYIRKELGMDGDDKTRLIDRFQERADALDMPTDVRRVFDDELSKFRGLEPTAGEYSTVRAYLDWLTSIPWGQFSEDKFAIQTANNLLDKSHFGLQDVKDRILEFLAVGKLAGSVDGKIICLVGPPGVGKTSIARTIADALGRKFDRFSVGGVYDVSEIKGHRRTYVAALPGRVIQALKKCKTSNPVILIDEIDKLARGASHGDPSAALLEVLDPEQNKTFQDTYMEVPVDLSRVLFVCTANNLENIPGPLMDRMEVINIPGYLPAEKVEIARKYLAPKAMKSSGLDAAAVNITKDAFNRLVTRYTRESGVRGLNKTIEKIYRKLAFNFVKEHELKEIESKDDETLLTRVIPQDQVGKLSLEIGENDLVKYVGVPTHNRDRLFDVLPAGVAMGLGWTPQGGVPLFVESVLQESLSTRSTPKLTRTGQLGEVMNESSSISYSFSRMYMTNNYPRNRFLDHAVIHTHFPEGSIKKDGPSAGIAMASSLISLAMNIPIKNTVAMTGELTLTGKVLQIGGLREKVVAAKTAGASVIIFPADNLAEWDELPEAVKEGTTPCPVKEFSDVFDVCFDSVDPAAVNGAWPQLQKEKEKEEVSKPAQVSATA